MAALAACGLALMGLTAAPGQNLDGAGLSIELIDPHVFRVCADPSNMPFSNDKEEGFENKLASLFAKKLGKSVAYTWYPGSTGFVRNTLGLHKCDVIMGFPQGDDIAQNTNPYYRTAYALVFKPGNGLDGIHSLSDPRLKSKRIGVVARTPPATFMAANGLLEHMKSYPLVVDTRVDSSAQAMIKDIEEDQIDAGVLWGPMAGFFSSKTNPKLSVAPLTDSGRPPLAFYIGLAVRSSDQEFKRLLNRLIQENQPEINRVLLSYGVPLLDEKNEPITAASVDTR